MSDSTAYINGNVFTCDADHPHAEAFIVTSDGIFSHVGTSAEIKHRASRQHFVIHDLHGEFIMPGIHDAHW
jgi:predicted amidohydrolase YtcJ